jgi:hypothetical protein
MEGTKMLGRPRLVDEEMLSLLDAPVRMLFHSHDPGHLPKSVMLFANLKGFRIGVEVETTKGLGGPSLGPDDKGNDDKGNKEDDREQTKDQSQSDRHWKRQPGSNKDIAKVGVVVHRGGVNQACPSPVMKTPPPQPKQLKADEVLPPVVVYGKNPRKRPGSKSAVGNSSVPLPSAKDYSAMKPASAPAKAQLSPIPFDQYGSNLSDVELLGVQTIHEPKALSMTIILDEDSPPSYQDIDPSVLKRSKLSEADRVDIG